MAASPKVNILSISDFWSLAAQSGLLSPQQCRQWQVEYQQAAVGTAADTADALAQWLVTQNRLTRYQAKVLLTGKPGPFLYGSYELLEKQASAPFAGCFRAVHRPTGHVVWLQFLGAEVVKEPTLGATYLARARRLCSLHHARLHQWHECVDLGAYKFLVMEALAGKSLREVVNAGKLEPARACWIAQQAAEACQALHEHGLAHGEVTPEQLWQDSNGTVRLLLHRLLPTAPDTEHLADRRAEYLAPELSMAGSQPNELTDVYALGCTLYELLTGRPPFAGGDPAEKTRRHATEPIRPLESLGFSPAIGQLVTYLMAKNPAVRIPRMANVLQQLAPLVGDEPHRLPPAVPPPSLEPYLATLEQRRSASGAPARPPAQAIPTTGTRPVAVRTPPAAPVPPNSAAPLPLARPHQLSPAPPVAIRARPEPRRRKPSRRRWLPAAILVGLLTAIGLGLFDYTRRLREGSQPAGPSVDVSQKSGRGDTTAADNSMTPDSSGTGSSDQTWIADDGKSLWASPTTGPAIDLAGVPPEYLTLVVIRPADMRRHPDGEKLLQAAGPQLEAWMRQWEAEAKVSWDNVQQLYISLHDYGTEPPRPAYGVRLVTPRSRAELLSGWGSPTEQVEEGGRYYVGANAAYYLTEPASGGGSAEGSEPKEAAIDAEQIDRFVFGPVEQVKAVAAARGAAPPLRSGAELLLRASDADRMITVLFVPHDLRSHLLRQGREFYFGEARKLREALDWYLGDGIRVGLFSLHTDSRLYLELAVLADLTQDRRQLATDLRQRLQQLPTTAEEYLARINPPEYWRRVAFRYPGMLRFLAEHARADEDAGVAIVNAFLPAAAGPNLMFATELLLASEPGIAAAATADTAGKRQPGNIEELLQERATTRFDQTSLEFAFRDVAQDVRDSHPGLPFEFEIRILGDDLEKDAITRNQSIVQFAMEDKTIAEVLTALVMRGNPITTVKQPNEKDQKLVWCIGDDPVKPGRVIILVTTRDGAAARGLKLPSLFQIPNP